MIKAKLLEAGRPVSYGFTKTEIEPDGNDSILYGGWSGSANRIEICRGTAEHCLSVRNQIISGDELAAIKAEKGESR